jgi:squalene-hopene/tetraprenyl-beta-curcumene cyclase
LIRLLTLPYRQREERETMKAHSRRLFLGQTLQTAGLSGLALPPSRGRTDEIGSGTELAAKAVSFLRPRQAGDGSWSGDRKEPGITALVVTAMLRSGLVTPDDAVVGKSLTYLERFVSPKGGLSEAPHSVYSTSVALMAFQAANKGGRFDRVIKGGQEFLKATQLGEGEGKRRDDPSYGGLGYGGGNSRPDRASAH